MCVTALSGCLQQSSGSAIGGVMKSDDSGRGFIAQNTIDEKRSLSGSNVLSLVIDPSNTNTIYVGTDSDDLYRSQDGSQTWQIMPTGLTNINNIAINPFSTSVIYVSGMYKGRGMVLQTTDSGETWEQVYIEPNDGTNITAMTISPVNGEMVYIGTSGGTIARTLNAGHTWENLYDAGNSVQEIQIDAGDVRTLYALISGNDIIKSRDDGMTFESVRTLERDNETESLYAGTVYSMTVSPTVSGVVVVGTDQGVFRSNDHGRSWNTVDVIASTIGIPIHAIDISPHDAEQIVYAAAQAVYTSVADGWAITDTTSNRIVNVIAHDPTDARVVYLGLKRAK
jgi:photosystem II stability/assembly factor-like uncharacterized protein